MMFSSSSARQRKGEIGLYFVGFAGLPLFLNTGITVADFQAGGKVPSSTLQLNNVVKESQSRSAH